MSCLSRFPLIALVACGWLAACTQTQTAAPLPPAAPHSASLVTPPGFKLPEGTGCSGEIARFRAVQDNDLATGHVNQRVYDQIKGEVDGAAATCAAGNDGAARSQLTVIKRRHGYPG
jgi:hypothetical protein